MKSHFAAGIAVCFAAFLQAQTPTPTPTASDTKKEPPKAEQSVTQHTAMIGGAPVSFTATAGTLIVRNEKDEPWASMGYVAYVRKDVSPASRRPIAFCYNGGPGSSSIWLHMGALGPKRVVVADAATTPPPPYQIVDNAYSLLDRVDIVLIDPVGTGVSKPVGDFKNQDFWGVDPDIESVSRFIKQYVSDNGRWNSPKYLIGESYGTTRSAGVVDWLQSKGGMAFNGVVLVSNATDLGAIFAMPGGSDLPYPFFIPSYAATAWYHKVLPNPPQELEPWLTEVRKFAAGEFTAALFEGDRLSGIGGPRSSRSCTSTRVFRRSTCASRICVCRRANTRNSSSARSASRSGGSTRASSARRSTRSRRRPRPIRNRTRSRRRTRRPSSTGTTAR